MTSTTSTTHPRRRGTSLFLAALGIITLFLGASVVGASAAGASYENKTDAFDIVFVGVETGETTSIFRYELTYDGPVDPDGDDDELSNLTVADFCRWRTPTVMVSRTTATCR